MSAPVDQHEQQLSSAEEAPTGASFRGTGPSVRPAEIVRVTHGETARVQDSIAV